MVFFLFNQGPLIVSQLNIWSSNYETDQIRNESNRCANNVSADILPWKTWETARLEGSWIQIPSLCDGMCVPRFHFKYCICVKSNKFHSIRKL